MFNPYFEASSPPAKSPALTSGLLEKLSKLDRDDLLILCLVFLLAKKSSKDDIWPLVAVALYCFL